MTKEMINALPTAVHIKGIREEDETLVEINGDYLDNLRLSLKIDNHSPTGFNWGYGGSGPAQLSLAILMKFLPVEDAQDYKQDFKWDVISQLPQGSFETTINLREKILSYFMARFVEVTVQK